MKYTSEEIIRSYLDAGKWGVLCWLSNHKDNPSTGDYIDIVTEVRINQAGYPRYKSTTGSWVCATPINLGTGRPLTKPFTELPQE